MHYSVFNKGRFYIGTNSIDTPNQCIMGILHYSICIIAISTVYILWQMPFAAHPSTRRRWKQEGTAFLFTLCLRYPPWWWSSTQTYTPAMTMSHLWAPPFPISGCLRRLLWLLYPICARPQLKLPSGEQVIPTESKWHFCELRERILNAFHDPWMSITMSIRFPTPESPPRLITGDVVSGSCVHSRSNVALRQTLRQKIIPVSS